MQTHTLMPAQYQDATMWSGREQRLKDIVFVRHQAVWFHFYNII